MVQPWTKLTFYKLSSIICAKSDNGFENRYDIVELGCDYLRNP